MSSVRPTEPAGDFRDLFLSYNTLDRPAVVAIRARLAAQGIATHYDCADLPLGMPWVDAVEGLIARVGAVAIFIGPHGVGRIQKREMQLALIRQAEEERQGKRFPVIPVLLEGAAPDHVSGLLALNTWIDTRSTDDSHNQLVEQFARALSHRGVRDEPPSTICPYRELFAFREEDAALYFGRGAAVERFVDRAQRERFLAVMGASGAGKSSFIQAGAVPRLRAQKGPRVWEPIVFTPGKRPFHSFATECVALWSPEGRTNTELLAEAEDLGDRLAEGTLRLETCVIRLDRILIPSPHLLIVVDQFEQLVTFGEGDASGPRPDDQRDEAAEGTEKTLSERFVAELLSLLACPNVTVVIAMRADFYGQAIELDAALSRHLEAGVFNLTPMGRDDLRAVIEQPALRSGCTFQEGLVERILDDVARQPNALPLLEFALTRLWAKSAGDRRLTRQAYEDIGSVGGAIAAHADEHYEKLDPTRRAIALSVLARFVRVSETGGAGGAAGGRVQVDELDPLAASVVHHFVAARLLTTVDGQQTEVVEVTHEALFRAWPKLTDWLDADRRFIVWRQRLRIYLEDWLASGRSPSELLSPAQVRVAETFVAQRGGELTATERALIHSSRAASARSRTRLVAIVAAAIGVLLSVAGFLVWRRSDSYQLRQARALAVPLLTQPSPAAEWLLLRALADGSEATLSDARAMRDRNLAAFALNEAARTLNDVGRRSDAAALARQAAAFAGESRLPGVQIIETARAAEELELAGAPLEDTGAVARLQEAQRTLTARPRPRFQDGSARFGTPACALASLAALRRDEQTASVLVRVAVDEVRMAWPGQGARATAARFIAPCLANAGRAEQAISVWRLGGEELSEFALQERTAVLAARRAPEATVAALEKLSAEVTASGMVWSDSTDRIPTVWTARNERMPDAMVDAVAAIPHMAASFRVAVARTQLALGREKEAVSSSEAAIRQAVQGSGQWASQVPEILARAGEPRRAVLIAADRSLYKEPAAHVLAVSSAWPYATPAERTALRAGFQEPVNLRATILDAPALAEALTRIGLDMTFRTWEKSLESDYALSGALVQRGLEAAALGNGEIAREAVSRLLADANSVESRNRQVFAAEVLAALGDADEAKNLLAGVTDQRFRARGCALVAGRLAERMRYADALAVSGALCPDELSRLQAVTALYRKHAEQTGLIRRGLYDIALIILKSNVRPPADW